ncbi:MAG TPA: VCBS repeat-containing protein, partial [Vicinamibacteria bacterium]|nr:VCBS repeat-containing protein [Vicinamibacteria bacterium]
MTLLAAFRFADVAASFGLWVRNVSGSEEKSYIIESTGSGGCFLDFDHDGDIDLYVVNGGRFDEPGAPDVLYRNEDGRRFVDVTDWAGIRDEAWGGGCAVGDVDNDGDPDLYVANFGRNRLYLNRGDGTFVEYGGIDDADAVSSSAAFSDLDLDGSLDLVVGTYLSFDRKSIAPASEGKCLYRGIPVYCGPDGLAGASNQLYRNLGDATFENVTETSGARRDDVKTLGLVLSDLDGDGLVDIYAACDSTINLFLRNLGGMRFEDVSLLSGAGYSGKGFEQSGMGVAAGDPDGDGDLDLFVTNFQNDTNTFYRNLGGGEFEDVTDRIGLGAPSMNYLSWGTHFADFDNDGDED